MTDFGTDSENQSAVDCGVMSGRRDRPRTRSTVRKWVWRRSPCLTGCRGADRSGWKFAISKDGRLGVSATDLTGGGSIDVEFRTEAVMNAEEVAERSTALRLMNVS